MYFKMQRDLVLFCLLSCSIQQCQKHDIIIHIIIYIGSMDSNYYPQDDDVICGRGKQFIHHTGNIRFRLAILMFMDRYMAARSKFDKSKIVLDIVSQFRTLECAFVKRCFQPIDHWIDIGDKMVVSAIICPLIMPFSEKRLVTPFVMHLQ
jgi:hypothetical protein